MEFEHLEFTMDEILAIHKGWMMKLCVEDRRTDVEIVELLSQQRLIVTLDDVQRCIREWNLEPPPEFPPLPSLEDFLSAPFYTMSSNQIHHMSPSPSQMLDSSSTPRTFTVPNHVQTTMVSGFNVNHNPLGPVDHDRYYTRPLPPIPSIQEELPPLNPLPFQPAAAAPLPPYPVRRCSNGHLPDECGYRVRYTLQAMPPGPSSLDVYTDTVHFHEKIAVRLVQETPKAEVVEAESESDVVVGETSESTSSGHQDDLQEDQGDHLDPTEVTNWYVKVSDRPVGMGMARQESQLRKRRKRCKKDAR